MHILCVKQQKKCKKKETFPFFSQHRERQCDFSLITHEMLLILLNLYLEIRFCF